MSLEQPNWNYWRDRALFNELFYRDNHGKPLTEAEERFCTTMYHYEEYASGLDGDREPIGSHYGEDGCWYEEGEDDADY